MSNYRRLSVDLAFAATVPFLAVWVYEISNLLVLVGQGSSVSITVEGMLPVGVAGVSATALSPLTKALQIGLSVGLLLPLAVFFSEKKLLLAKLFVVSTVGVYLASAYWELLSSLTALSMEVHTLIFIIGASAASLAILWKSRNAS